MFSDYCRSREMVFCFFVYVAADPTILRMTPTIHRIPAIINK